MPALTPLSDASTRLPPDASTAHRCTRCLYDDTVSGIRFNAHGVCSYCDLHDEMDAQYPTGPAGERVLEKLVDDLKRAGRGKKYDCILGVSGGCDSSFLAHTLVERGLRPLAVHFDNTWNSPIATQNIYNVLTPLKIDLYTHVVNSREYDDLYRAFMLSGLKDIEGPTDLAMTATAYRAAIQYGVGAIINGHSFRTEGVSPLGWLYMDGKLVQSVHKRHGREPLKTYPLLTLRRFIQWSALHPIKMIRPLYYMDYRKEDAKALLSERYGWQWYGGHHLENRFTSFYHTYFLPRRGNLDTRLLGHAALVRSGQLERDEALAQLQAPQECPPEILALVKKRLGFSDAEFGRVMTAPLAHYSEFATYKRDFERLRPLFWLLYKLDRVPKSFYLKFCFPAPASQADRARP